MTMTPEDHAKAVLNTYLPAIRNMEHAMEILNSVSFGYPKVAAAVYVLGIWRKNVANSEDNQVATDPKGSG